MLYTGGMIKKRQTDSIQDQEGRIADNVTDLECQENYLNEGETVEETDEDESGEEITGLEELLTSVVKDLSSDYTDNEDYD